MYNTYVSYVLSLEDNENNAYYLLKMMIIMSQNSIEGKRK